MNASVELVAGYKARNVVWFLINVDFPDDDRDVELVMQSRADWDKGWDVVDDAMLDVMRNAAISCRNELPQRFPPKWLLDLHENDGEGETPPATVIQLPAGLKLELPVPTT